MGLGTGVEVDNEQAAEAKSGRRPHLGMGKDSTRAQAPCSEQSAPRAGRGSADSLSEVDGLLCAAAYLRYDHAGAVVQACARFLRIVPRGLWIVLTRHGENRKQKLKKLAERLTAESDQPRILFGHQYVSWVRRRIAAGRPVPPHGFHLTPVLQSAASAEGLTHLRRLLLILVAAAAVVAGLRTGFLVAVSVAFGGAWAACYVDRVWARHCLRRKCWTNAPGKPDLRVWLGPRRRSELGRDSAERDGRVVPYRLNLRRYRAPTHSVVGAGRLWSEDAIGIDVAAAMSADAQRAETAEQRLVRQVFQSVNDMVHGDDERFEPFTPEELHHHVDVELHKLLDPRSDHQPHNDLKVSNVAAYSATSWNSIEEDEWKSLLTLAAEGPGTDGAHRETKRARRMLCTRIVSWDGDLVALLYVSFAYEHHYLRITARPHVINPVNTRLRKALAAAERTGLRRTVREVINALLDVFALPGPLLRPFTRPRPEEDGEDPASLRDAYSCRHMDDMLQYDDARRHIAWMERRVFRAVLDFLQKKGVDISDFLRQATVILNNSGVVHAGSGSMSNVQNQPGSVNSTSTMTTSSSSEGDT